MSKVFEKISLSNGLQLSLSKSPAIPTFKQWAVELENTNGPRISYELAVRREREVVSAIDNGLWPEEVYVEYQKLVSTTGNVDSARLLVKYGLEAVIEGTVALQSQAGQFHHAVMFCKGERSLVYCTI